MHHFLRMDHENFCLTTGSMSTNNTLLPDKRVCKFVDCELTADYPSHNFAQRLVFFMSCPLRSPLEYACDLNNKSCCLIKQGHMSEAISNLMVALKEMRKIAIAGTDAEHCFASQCRSKSSRLGFRSAVSQCCDNHSDEFETLCRNDTNLSLSYSSQQFIYQSPVFIHKTSETFDEPSIASISFYIMFNLALANHMKGFQGDPEAYAGSLSVSRRLYELTFQMQAQESESNLMLMAAMLNNLFLVHQELGNESEAERCQQLLLSTLLLLVDMGEQSVATARFQSDLEGLMGNVMHLMSTESPIARAA